jgi:hypothetical protein
MIRSYLRKHRAARLFVFIGVAAASAACSSSGSRPVLASSASHASYAVRYPDAVAATTKTIAADQSEEKQLSSGFAAHLDELKKPDWDKVLAVVEKADESGKSAGYAEGYAEHNAARTFWNEEREQIGAKVSGNAQYAAKQGGCSVDVGGAAAYALKDSVDKQLEKRLRARNEAFLLLERHGASLGKENVAALEKLADEVARARYLVHVDMPEQREKLRAQLAERSNVATTLDRAIQEERALQSTPGRTDAEKKASEERVNAASKSRAEVERAAAAGDETMKTVDARIEAATKEYEEALKALKAKIADKKKTAG